MKSQPEAKGLNLTSNVYPASPQSEGEVAELKGIHKDRSLGKTQLIRDFYFISKLAEHLGFKVIYLRLSSTSAFKSPFGFPVVLATFSLQKFMNKLACE